MKVAIAASIIVVLLIAGWFVPSKESLDADPAANAFHAAKSEQELIRVALGQFKKTTGRIPTAQQGLEALRTSTGGGPYLSTWFALSDPWGTPYHYIPSEDGKEFNLYSAGPNKIDEKGGGDDVR
jgi:hypothetical protein